MWCKDGLGSLIEKGNGGPRRRRSEDSEMGRYGGERSCCGRSENLGSNSGGGEGDFCVREPKRSSRRRRSDNSILGRYEGVRSCCRRSESIDSSSGGGEGDFSIRGPERSSRRRRSEGGCEGVDSNRRAFEGVDSDDG